MIDSFFDICPHRMVYHSMGDFFMRFSRCFSVILSFSLLLLTVCGSGFFSVLQASVSQTDPLVIIDPGHGGADAGAIGTQGSLEKTLNMAIAEELALRFKEAGIPVLLTRTTDALVLHEGEDIKGQRKQKDLYNRVALANAYPNATLVSIHMNAYPVSKYRGLQVYYNQKSAESALLARRITDKVRSELDPVYTRVPNFRGDSLYILANATGRAVLVEGGFLSNAEEEAKLLEKDYEEFCKINRNFGEHSVNRFFERMFDV